MPPGPQPLASNQSNAEQMVDPIARFQSSDEPWHPLMRNPDSDINQSVFQVRSEFGQYRQGPCSDNDNVSDSGYQTQPPPSVLSNEPGRLGQELPPELLFQTRGMNVNVRPTVAQPMRRTASDQRSVSQHSSRSGAPKQQIPCDDPTCAWISGCPSEHKYV